MKSSGRTRARALPICLLLLASVAAEGDLLLTSLPAKLYRGSRWRQTLVETWGSNKLRAFTRELKGGKDLEETEPKAVVKVVARAKLPVRMLVEVFQSQDEAVVEAWNPVIGEVQHFASGEQLQTYKLPWPFAPREYLVRCSESKVARSGFQAACAPIDGHPKAPPRTDRVRGKSETIWRFTEQSDGQTEIVLETLVDPGGVLPVWLVDKLGRSTAVKIVRSLVKYTGERVARAKANAAVPPAAPLDDAQQATGSGPWGVFSEALAAATVKAAAARVAAADVKLRAANLYAAVCAGLFRPLEE